MTNVNIELTTGKFLDWTRFRKITGNSGIISLDDSFLELFEPEIVKDIVVPTAQALLCAKCALNPSHSDFKAGNECTTFNYTPVKLKDEVGFVEASVKVNGDVEKMILNPDDLDVPYCMPQAI